MTKVAPRRADDWADVAALRGIIDAVPHPIFVKDDEGRFVIVNAAMCTLMGRDFGVLVGKLDRDFVPLDQAQLYEENDRQVLQNGATNESEEPFTDGSGGERTIVTRKKRFVLPSGKPLLVGCITDISDFRRAEAVIRHHAEHDHLTGLPNRSLFKEELQSVASIGSADRVAGALLLVDLDGFKSINDTLGHSAGDNILVQTANALTEIIRGAGSVARLGGDEFAIVQTPTRQPGAATKLASEVVRRLARPAYVDRTRVMLSASIGIAVVDQKSGGDPDCLFRNADAALYAAKKAGRNRWVQFADKALAPAAPA